jgi:hypothetical protein
VVARDHRRLRTLAMRSQTLRKFNTPPGVEVAIKTALGASSARPFDEAVASGFRQLLVTRHAAGAGVRPAIITIPD